MNYQFKAIPPSTEGAESTWKTIQRRFGIRLSTLSAQEPLVGCLINTWTDEWEFTVSRSLKQEQALFFLYELRSLLDDRGWEIVPEDLTVS